MVAASPFPEWLAEVTADGVVVRPDDTTAEARSNLWSFGLSAEQRAVVTASDVVAFIDAVSAARGRWLAVRGLGPMRFYCWHDTQAGQLRFSLVSGGSIRHLFGAPIEPVSIPRAVAQDFLSGGESGCRLLVWVTTVP